MGLSYIFLLQNIILLFFGNWHESVKLINHQLIVNIINYILYIDNISMVFHSF